jgi:hypothetical protein
MGIGIPAANQMHELLRRRFIFAAGVSPSLFRHGAAHLPGVCSRIGEVADIGRAAAAHDVSPANFCDNARPQTKLQKIWLPHARSDGRSRMIVH